MDAQGSRILIYSAATRSDEDMLKRHLSAIGYADTARLDDGDRLEGFARHAACGALVLLLTDEAHDQDALLGLLHQAKSLPAIGLFSETCSRSCMPVVKACHEVAIWPCSKRELDFRIGKLISKNNEQEDLGRSLFIKMNILGNSPEFLQVLDRVRKIVNCDAPVYIGGETGTGKELIARAIHYLGGRADQPFIAVNCGAIPDQLVENELFGHDRGAYTDAHEASDGVIARAEGGTLFLDEIETLSGKGQIVLLRFLESMMYRPLGCKSERSANVRVVTATNESISQLVEEGRFRKDLYYRVNIMNLLLPPLRRRRGDINLLAEHFIRQYQIKYKQPDKELHPDSAAALQYYDWPGNVRELENMLHREFLLSDGKFISIKELEAMKRERRTTSGDRRMKKLLDQPMVVAKKTLVKDFERRYLATALHKAKGNISEAARLAGKERRSFTRLLEKYAIECAHSKTH